MKYLLTALLLLSMNQFSHAEGEQLEKRYVTDVVWLQLRSGPSSQNRIIKALKSGEHLQILAEDADAGYTQVRAPDGKEGWVLTRYLSKEPIALERLIIANRRLEALKAEQSTTKTRLKELEEENKVLKSERAKLKQVSSSTSEELANLKELSSGAIELDEKAKRLTVRNQGLEIQMEALRAENEGLKDNRQQTYLIYGGGLVIAGILAGLILPSLRSRKRSDWS